MPITFSCACGKSLSVPDTMAGKRGKCPACGEVVQIPEGQGPTGPSDVVLEADVRCGACGSTFKHIKWKPGMKCIGCGSDEAFEPVIKTDAELPIVHEEGPTIKDRLMGATEGGWKDKPIIGIVAVLVILVSAIAILKDQIGSRPKLYPSDMICNACGFQDRVKVKEPTPLKCPNCGKKQFYHGLKCTDCGTIFAHVPPEPPEEVVDDEGNPIDPEAYMYYEDMPVCPKCGSYNLTVPTPYVPPPAD